MELLVQVEKKETQYEEAAERLAEKGEAAEALEKQFEQAKEEVEKLQGSNSALKSSQATKTKEIEAYKAELLQKDQKLWASQQKIEELNQTSANQKQETERLKGEVKRLQVDLLQKQDVIINYQKNAKGQVGQPLNATVQNQHLKINALANLAPNSAGNYKMNSARLTGSQK